MYRPVPFGTEAKFTRSTAYEVAETNVTQVMDFARMHREGAKYSLETKKGLGGSGMVPSPNSIER